MAFLQLTSRFPSKYVISKRLCSISDELSNYLHGRKNSERSDSITHEILRERKLHRERFQCKSIDPNIVRKLIKMGLGSKKRKNLLTSSHVKSTYPEDIPRIGAGGFALHLASSGGGAKGWPVFK